MAVDTNEMESITKSTICSFCGTGCGLVVTANNGKIVSVVGDKSSPVSHGETCVKGSQAWTYSQSKDRLTYPMVRKNGKLVRATWDEALAVIAAGVQRVQEEHGADAFGCFSSSRATNELNFLAQKLMRQVIGTNNIDSCNRT